MGGAVPDGVRIQTDEVHDFASKVRKDADSGLTSAAQRGRALHGEGVVFGQNIEGDIIRAAKAKYAEALQNTEANLRTYVMMARILADAAAKVAEQFGHADMSSAEQQNQVKELLRTGMDQAKALELAGQHVSGVRAL